MIREATPEDVPAMLALERGSPSAVHWPESKYRQIFDKEGPARIALIVSAESNDSPEINGFAVAAVAGGECDLENIGVAEQAQRRGLGMSLMQALATEARAHNASGIFLEVRESNAAARRLYEKCGFAITGRRPSYYAAPIEDAILYALSL